MRWQLDRRGLLLLAAAWALGAVPAAAENARQILLDSLQPRVSTYVGEQVTEISGAGLPPRARLRGRQKQQVYRTARTLRIDFENGPVIFDNGESQIHYFPRQNVVERSPSNLGARRVLGVRRALASGRAEVEQLADDSLAGRAAYVISIRDTQGQKPDPTAKRINNGITGDGRKSSAELGKRLYDMKLNAAVTQIQALLK